MSGAKVTLFHAGSKARALVDCILDDVRVKMLEDIVLIETCYLVDEKNLQFVHERYGVVSERTVLYYGPITN